MTDAGTVFLHGGGATQPEIIRAFVQTAGGPEKPIVVLAQTSEDPVQKGNVSAAWLRENGAKVVNAPGGFRPDAASTELLTALLARAAGVWIPGGDQTRWMLAFRNTPILDAIRAVRERGGAVGGTSAGASLMGQVMPTGEGDRTRMTVRSVETAPGIGLLNKTIVDSHFFARERVQRLINMVLSQPGFTGIGIDERAWVTVSRNHLTVHSGQAMLVRSAGSTAQDPEKRIAAKDVRLQILLPGQSASLK
ncbi:MAG: cyanophycinase [Capsulimonadales bacterium]|nr:cyanophycinase [Capsulimonadales bacterium]